MPRPTKLTDDTQKRIIQAIELGATYELASQFGGIAYNTFNEWMKAGERAESGAKRDFYEAVKQAEGKAAVKWLLQIEKASAENWQSAAWKLERRYPDTYGRRDIRHSGRVNVDVTKLTDDELQRIIEDESGG